ncbi:MAG TPA: hypothetical protein VK760_03180 [Candidatus Acidoferrales bacterium]|nr:hypothetical protein [Candidatus Acidoferrales bacterium]
MTFVYIGVGVAVLVVILIFGGMNWRQNQLRAAAYATPTPGPSPSGKPIALQDGPGGNIGVAYFKSKIPDAPKGGMGLPVDGIQCGGMEYANLHIHPHLSLFVNGKQVQIPQGIGFGLASGANPQGCLYWIHTHDASGIIHIEAPQIEAPAGGPFTLGMLFDVWGQPLADTGVAGAKGPVTAYVNGSPYTGDLRAIPLLSHQQITLEVGQPVVTPPSYTFPPND